MPWVQLAVMAAGTIFSAVNGAKQARQAADAQGRANARLDSAEGMAAQEREWFNEHVNPLREKMLDEANKEGLSRAGIYAQDQIQRNLEEQRRRLAMRPGGVTADQNLALGIEGARALSTATMQDAGMRDQARARAISMGSQTPESLKMQLGLQQQRAGIEMQQAGQYGQAAAGAWGQVAGGMSGLADIFSKMNTKPAGTTTTTTGEKETKVTQENVSDSGSGSGSSTGSSSTADSKYGAGASNKLYSGFGRKY